MAAHIASLSISASLANLHEAQEFVRQQATQAGVQAPDHSKVDLVVEELFVNIVNHAIPRDTDSVEIGCFLEPASAESKALFCIIFRDWGPPFNPLEQLEPSLGSSLEERPIGGLGIFMVNRMADRCSYGRNQDANEFQVCFSL